MMRSRLVMVGSNRLVEACAAELTLQPADWTHYASWDAAANDQGHPAAPPPIGVVTDLPDHPGVARPFNLIPIVQLDTPGVLTPSDRQQLQRAFPRFDCIVAADRDGGIGKNNQLPWPPLPEDLRFFARITSAARPGMQNVIVMGRRTWESIPERLQPLRNRHNVVVTRGPFSGRGAHAVPSLPQALAYGPSLPEPPIDAFFVIGGAQLYAEAFAHPRCRYVYLTRIHASFPCDRHLPDLTTAGFALDPQWAISHGSQRIDAHGTPVSSHDESLPAATSIEYSFERWVHTATGNLMNG